ncbi:MAG: xylulokinase, partial [Anaerolineae bacterium]
MSDIILGVDIGTTSTKAIAFDARGAEVASASRSYGLLTPRPGWVEQDAGQVWQALLEVLRAVAARAPGRRIVALALAVPAGSIIPADAAGNPVHPIITWLDHRADGLVAGWQRDGTAERIRQRSGWHPSPGLPLPVIAWLRSERPDVHARARRYLGVADFLIHRLTGRLATDLSAACEMLLVGADTAEWDAELCAIGGVAPAMQAGLGWAGRIIGPIAREVAAATGLPADTLVVAGGADQQCACLGMGMAAPGRVALATGTAWVITTVTDTPQLERIPPTMDLSFHVVPGRRTLSRFLGGFGATVDWWLAQTWQPPDRAQAWPAGELYPYLNAAVSESAPGSRGLLFTPLGGPSQVPGAAAGGVLAGLQLAHTRGDMARAILEGCGFEVRWALAELRSGGLATSELWIAGGAAASPVWPQILADIGGVPVVLADYGSWAALGAAA